MQADQDKYLKTEEKMTATADKQKATVYTL
jgi:hypothetical protein